MNILNQHQVSFPHLLEAIDSLRVYYDQKLWKQLSDTLLQYIKDPQLNQGTHLKDLYEGFVKRFHTEIEEMKLVRFIIKAVDQYGDYQSRIDFLSQFKLDEQPQLVLNILIAYFLLQQGKLQEVDELLKQYKTKCEKLQDVDPLVYSMLYYLAYNFYKIKNVYEEFYVNALQYLAYTNDQDMQQEQKVQLSQEMALAVLLSPNIYNFSELLQQPVLSSLKESSQHNWIYQLLEIFNRGNVRELSEFQWNEERKAMIPNFTVLNEKIRIMAFLELAFSLPKNNRVCTFQELAKVSELQLNDIEKLVMRTISKGLVKGKINQVEQKVTITYVVPRVLTMDKIEIMNKKFDSWEHSLGGFLKSIDEVKQQFK